MASRQKFIGLGLASISLSYYVIGHFSGKNRVKFGNFVIFSDNNLKSYVVNHHWVLFTARCTLVESAVLRSHVVCLAVCLHVTLTSLSVCDVGEL